MGLDVRMFSERKMERDSMAKLDLTLTCLCANQHPKEPQEHYLNKRTCNDKNSPNSLNVGDLILILRQMIFNPTNRLVNVHGSCSLLW